MWFAALAILITYPLIRSLDTHVPGNGAGDNLAFLWNFWWARFVLDGGSPDYFRTAHLFAPFGTSLVLNTNTPLQAWIGATLLGGLPIVRAHNVVLLCGLAANGLTTYLLAYRCTRQPWPALLAGTAFANCAYVSVRLLGHFNLAHAWVLPLAALAWLSLIESPSLRRSVAAGAAFSLIAYCDYYYLVYAVIFAACWWAVTSLEPRLVWRSDRLGRARRGLLTIGVIALAAGIAIRATSGISFQVGQLHVSATQARNPMAIAGLCALAWIVLQTSVVLTQQRTAFTTRRTMACIAMAVVASAVLTLPLIVAAVSLAGSGDYVSQQYFWRSAPRGVDVATVVLGNPMHTMFGRWTRAAYGALGIDPMEQTAWLGIVPMLLLAGAIRFRQTLPGTTPWVWIAGIFAVWSLGPYLRVAGLDTGVLLPQVLTRYIPIVSNARMPGRAFVVVQLAACVLGAIAVTRWRWNTARVVTLTAAVLIEGLTTPYPLYRLPLPDSIDSRLHATGTGAVIELPSGIRDGFGEWGHFDHRALVHQMAHERPLAGGFAARLAPSIDVRYRQIPALAGIVDLSAAGATADSLPPDLGSLLAGLGIDSVIVNTDALTTPLRTALERRGLRFVMAAGSRELYAISR